MLGSTALCSLAGLAALAVAAPPAKAQIAPGFTCADNGLCKIDASGTNGASRTPPRNNGNGGFGDDGTPGTDATATIPNSTAWTAAGGGPVPAIVINTTGGGGGNGGAADNDSGTQYNGGPGGAGKNVDCPR